MRIEPLQRFNGMDPGQTYDVKDVDGKFWIEQGVAKEPEKIEGGGQTTKGPDKPEKNKMTKQAPVKK